MSPSISYSSRANILPPAIWLMTGLRRGLAVQSQKGDGGTLPAKLPQLGQQLGRRGPQRGRAGEGWVAEEQKLADLAAYRPGRSRLRPEVAWDRVSSMFFVAFMQPFMQPGPSTPR